MRLWPGDLKRIDEDLILTGGEDGWIRLLETYPHRIFKWQKHSEDLEEKMSITKLGVSHCQRIVASLSHDMTVNFYDLTELKKDFFGQKNEKNQKSKLEKKSIQNKNDDFFANLIDQESIKDSHESDS